MSNKHTITRRLPMAAILTLLTISAISTPSQAQPDLQIRQIGAWGGSVDAVVIEQNGKQTLAYIGSGVRLVILDVTDPANIIELGSTIVGTPELGGGVIRDIKLRDGYAFIAAGMPGQFSIVDVTDPSDPVVVTAANGGGSNGPGTGAPYESVHLYGNIAYVHQSNQENVVPGCFDITDLENPVITGCGLVNAGGTTMLISGDLFYTTTNEGGIKITDLTENGDPNGVWLPIPELEDVNGTFMGLALDEGNFLYVTGYKHSPENESRLIVVDISNHEAPFVAGMWTQDAGPQGVNGWVNEVEVSGGRLYVSLRHAPFDDLLRRQLVVFDIAIDPTSPTQLGEYWSESVSATGLTVVGTTVYLQDERQGLIILDASDPENVAPIGGFFSPAIMQQGALDSGWLYVTDQRYGVSVVDVSDARAPEVVGAFPTGPKSWGIAVRDDLAYVAAGYTGLKVLDVADPASPMLAGTFPFPGPRAVGLSLDPEHENIVHVGTIPGAFLVNFDVSDLQNIVDVGAVNISGATALPRTIASGGGFAHVARDTATLAVDVIDPFGPFVVFHSGPLTPPEPPQSSLDLALDGNILYRADKFIVLAGIESLPGLHILDVSNPAEPVELGYYGEGSGSSTTVEGSAVAARSDRAYMGVHGDVLGSQALEVFDVSDPTSPSLLAAHHAGDTPINDLIVDGQIVYAITSHWQTLGAGVLTYLVYVAGDFNDDGGVDELDADAFANCFTGPDVEPGDVTCLIFDADLDNDIDCADWEAFKLAWTAKGDPPPFAPCDPPSPCPWDLDSSGTVNTNDLLALFAQWGTPGTADFDGSGAVNTADLLILFANWGPCG
ncbi:MAG: hypothetical protein IH984_10670 [Planctomycetes bacterium]|nr:hypothetical protein [Planctomycetota bacterium]